MNLYVNFTKSFKSGFRLDASFIMNGRHLGVFGQSGGGKSTLVNVLAGVERPDSGEILLDGTAIFSSERGIDLPPEKRGIGMVFQHAHLFPHLSVRSNLLYGWNRCVPERKRIEPDQVVEVLEIGGLMARGVSHLSGGERQRVALGRALLANPRLLLMDEPLSGLDDDLRFKIIPYLHNACDAFGIPYIFISHSLVEMRLMSKRVLVLENGRQIADTDSDKLVGNGMSVAANNLYPYSRNASPSACNPVHSEESTRRRGGRVQRRRSCST